jgi:hypothetical protein
LNFGGVDSINVHRAKRAQEAAEVAEKTGAQILQANSRARLSVRKAIRASHTSALLPSRFKPLLFRLSKIKDSQLERELLYLGESARNENCCQEKKLVLGARGIEGLRRLGI